MAALGRATSALYQKCGCAGGAFGISRVVVSNHEKDSALEQKHEVASQRGRVAEVASPVVRR
jgi:hypothetical protein